jgi:hypothetical protein
MKFLWIRQISKYGDIFIGMLCFLSGFGDYLRQLYSKASFTLKLRPLYDLMCCYDFSSYTRYILPIKSQR